MPKDTMQLRQPHPFRAASWCLDAQSSEYGAVELSRTIRVSLDLYPFCTDAMGITGTGTVAAAGSAVTLYTHPSVQPLHKMFVRSIALSRDSGDNTLTSLLLRSGFGLREPSPVNIDIRLDSWAAAASRIVVLQQPLWIGPGDLFYADCAGVGVAETVFRVNFWVDRLRVG